MLSTERSPARPTVRRCSLELARQCQCSLAGVACCCSSVQRMCLGTGSTWLGLCKSRRWTTVRGFHERTMPLYLSLTHTHTHTTLLLLTPLRIRLKQFTAIGEVGVDVKTDLGTLRPISIFLLQRKIRVGMAIEA
jgi:hypothetical protein